jgi:hypothetical protein
MKILLDFDWLRESNFIEILCQNDTVPTKEISGTAVHQKALLKKKCVKTRYFDLRFDF